MNEKVAWQANWLKKFLDILINKASGSVNVVIAAAAAAAAVVCLFLNLRMGGPVSHTIT